MKNKEMFDRANRTDDDTLKLIIRDRFLLWCHKNGRTAMNTQSILDWWGLDWEEEDV